MTVYTPVKADPTGSAKKDLQNFIYRQKSYNFTSINVKKQA